jgi:hypothetical protein
MCSGIRNLIMAGILEGPELLYHLPYVSNSFKRQNNMQFRIILLLLVSLMGSLKLKASRNSVSEITITNNEPVESFKRDSVRDEFNLNKINTKTLIKGKKSETILKYYEFYLQEKDKNRADSLMNDLLKRNSSVEYKYQISLLSDYYNSDSKTQTLFLSDSDRIKEYRTYFLERGVSNLKSNVYKRTHYYNLVSIDSAYYRMVPDSLVGLQMANHYNSLTWYSILTQKFNNVEYYLDQSKRYNPKSKYPNSNSPLLLLFEKRYHKAKILYLKFKDQPFDKNYPTYKDVFLEDFRELEKEGIITGDMKKIIRLLNDKTK